MRPRPKRPAAPARKQATPQELRDELLAFLERKFYQGRPVVFAKDCRRLLEWVVLWPARWLDDRDVTIPADRYRDIFIGVFMDGLRFGNTSQITYLPAWLAKVIQSHFEIHGEEYYEQAKSMRSMIEHTLMVTGRLAQKAPEPVTAMAAAHRLLRAPKAPKRPAAGPVNQQLSLL